MNFDEFKTALETAKIVKGFVKFSEHDGFYIKLVKSDVLEMVTQHLSDGMFPYEVNIDAEFNETKTHLYIN
jgi:hypothetical protein